MKYITFCQQCDQYPIKPPELLPPFALKARGRRRLAQLAPSVLSIGVSESNEEPGICNQAYSAQNPYQGMVRAQHNPKLSSPDTPR